jgi:hypothetical protein
MKIIIIGMAILALLLVGCSKTQSAVADRASSFEECISAGNPIIESYPPQCKTADGKVFTKELPGWKTDGITMMRLSEGNTACFGCGATQCIDPIPGLEVVEETEELHCTGTFEVVGSESAVGRGMPVPSDNPAGDVVVNAGMPVPGGEPVDEMIVEE